MNGQTALVVFDLDGTLTRRDTYIPFLLGCLWRKPWRVLRLLLLPWHVLMFAFRLQGNAALKENFLRAFLGGMREDEVAVWAEAFVDRLLRRGMRAGGLAVLEQHREAGDYLVLMSASLDLYVPLLGKRLGFARVICTETERRAGEITGRLAGANRRGAEKLRCLEALEKEFPDRATVLYADHMADIPILRRAARGVLVNGGARARRLAARFGIETAQW